MIILNTKAKTALGGVLMRFGQLLELDCEGETEYLFNVTNLIGCLDSRQTEYYEAVSTAIKKAAFLEHLIPSETHIFKIPETAAVELYANEAAKQELELLAKSAGLTGLSLVDSGAPVS